MTTKLRTLLAIFIASILTPYIAVIFFIRIVSLFIILPIFLVALVLLIVSTIGAIIAEPLKSRKKYYWLISVASVIFFIFSYGFQLTAADWVFFKSRESKLTIFITELQKYKKIKEMSDGQRFWKTINETSIASNINDVDTTENSLKQKYFLEDILIRDGIDKQHYEFFRQILISTDIESFNTLDDGAISFTIDGFLDNCNGIAYSETGARPKNNDCGEIISWTKIGEHWYAWGTT